MTRESLLTVLAIAAVSRAAAQHGRVVIDTVKSPSLISLVGDPLQTRVSIYLPPSYDRSPGTRYPVIYLLHGFMATDEAWGPGRYDVAGLMDSMVAARTVGEMIIVMPNAFNRFSGSFYVNSAIEGNWEDFIAHNLVEYVDHRYRTLATAASRGIAGHSMGGYGAFYLSMHHGGMTYGATYALSACCSHSSAGLDPAHFGAQWDTIATLTSFEQLAHSGFFVRAIAGESAAFAPDPERPPLFFDLEVVRKDGRWQVDPAVQAKWDAHSTQLMVPYFRSKLLRMRGIAFDIGLQDQAVPPAELMAMDSTFSRANIPHTFETYQGDHVKKIRNRLSTRVLPFFTRTLVFQKGP